jgi:hypothetical protein
MENKNLTNNSPSPSTNNGITAAERQIFLYKFLRRMRKIIS